MANPTRKRMTNMVREGLDIAAFAISDEVTGTAFYLLLDWKSRYGDNARVGGLPLEESTIADKGHDAKLVANFENSRMRDAIRLTDKEAFFGDTAVQVEQSVVTDHWLFPIHEYGLNQPAHWSVTNALIPRTTLSLSEAEIAVGFEDRVRDILRMRLRQR